MCIDMAYPLLLVLAASLIKIEMKNLKGKGKDYDF
jgi:hypothetical protein